MIEASMQVDNYKPCTGIDTLSATDATYADSLFHEGQVSAVLALSATVFDLTKDSVTAANPQRLRKGGFFVTFQSRGSDTFIRFRSTSGSPGTTITATSNGLQLIAGTIYRFFISANERYIDVRSTADCSLFWFRSSARKDGFSP